MLLTTLIEDLCIICRFGNTYGYGFAFAKHSPYTPLFNVELFRLQKDFKISSFTHKWMKESVKCEMMDNFEEQKERGLMQFGVSVLKTNVLKSCLHYCLGNDDS